MKYVETKADSGIPNTVNDQDMEKTILDVFKKTGFHIDSANI